MIVTASTISFLLTFGEYCIKWSAFYLGNIQQIIFYVLHFITKYQGTIYCLYLGTWSVGFPDDVGHASFETQEGSQMRFLGRIILRKSLDFTPVPGCPLLRVKSHRPMTRGRKFSMRLKQNRSMYLFLFKMND